MKGLGFKLIILWVAIFLLVGFWLTTKETTSPVSLVIVPVAPRQDEPVIATFKLNNPASQASAVKYQFSVNGEILEEGTATIPPESSKLYQYAGKSTLQLGKQLNFTVKTWSDERNYEKVVSTPPYPPQIWSSFVSFASFSTAVMSSLTSMEYYNNTFPAGSELNLGIIISVVLIALLVFLELSQPVARGEGKAITVMTRLKFRFSTLCWLLLIIFLGIVYTKVAMIIAT